MQVQGVDKIAGAGLTVNLRIKVTKEVDIKMRAKMAAKAKCGAE